jgi:hypothetical protein
MNKNMSESNKRDIKTDGLINGKTIEEVLGKDWEKKFESLSGEEIIKERNRLKRLIEAERIKEILKENVEIERMKDKLSKYIVGSSRNEKTGCQKCKKCDRDVVDLKKSQQALDTIKLYQEHEKKYHE